jgi:hypothetical protein
MPASSTPAISHIHQVMVIVRVSWRRPGARVHEVYRADVGRPASSTTRSTTH